MAFIPHSEVTSVPTVELMTWSVKQKRWFKKYRGKMYAVSPKALDCEATKEASKQNANAWWTKKQDEIHEQLGKAKRHPAHVVEGYQEAIELHRLYAKWNRKYGSPSEAEASEKIMEFLHEALKGDNPPFPLPKRLADPRFKLKRVPQLATEDIGDLWMLWWDRFNTIKKEEREETAVPKENTIRAHVEDYLALRKAQFQTRGKIGSYDSLEQWLGVFKAWTDPYAPIESLNEQLWEKFFIHLSKKAATGDYSPATAKDYLAAARMFIRSRWERNLIPLPRNLTSRALSFHAPLKAPVLFTVKEVKQYLKAANERQKLYLLLALNCGMYPVDIAMLSQDEVDWKNGRISRKRTKTRDRSPSVPKVDYCLWKETFRLLKKNRSNHPELVLVNENASPLWVPGKRQNNNVKCAFFRLQLQLKLKKERAQIV